MPGDHYLPTLTLWQPHASLTMLRASGADRAIKWIETRSWPAPERLIGQYIGIHAAARTPEVGLRLGREAHHLPTGVLLGTGRLDACVPMVDELGGPDDPIPRLCITHRGLKLMRRGQFPSEDVSDQAPFGWFEPGRWAWLLSDAKPTTERCPWCLGDGGFKEDSMPLYGVPGGEDWGYRCEVCKGGGRCDPIPAKGRQRVWRWTPERAT